MDPINEVERFVVHYSASDPTRTTVGDIRQWHVVERGWDDIGYHYVISGLGLIHAGRNLTYDPAAQLGHNDKSLAVCVVGHNLYPELSWRREQVHALLELWAASQVLFPRIEPFGHRDLTGGTDCPGLDIRPMLLGPRYRG